MASKEFIFDTNPKSNVVYLDSEQGQFVTHNYAQVNYGFGTRRDNPLTLELGIDEQLFDVEDIDELISFLSAARTHLAELQAKKHQRR